MQLEGHKRGMKAISLATQAIKCGDADVVVA